MVYKGGYVLAWKRTNFVAYEGDWMETQRSGQDVDEGSGEVKNVM